MAVNEKARTEHIAKLLGEVGIAKETMRVPLKGRQELLPVIRVSLDSTVLNPKSHRIRSQLESIPVERKELEIDPDSDISQELIRNLLRATPGFDLLKQNLKDEGQKDPGIITREGRLINANTRAVALRDLGIEYIEVAVLPAATTIGEILDLELELQVAQDFRQDYSFTNELLFVDDLVSERGLNEEAIAVRLRWATPTKATSLKTGTQKVKRYIRHLALIREIQAMSGGAVPLTDFDDAEQALHEFDTAYESIRGRSPEKAERLKNARTLGLLVDLGYERQRAVDSDWVEQYFSEAIDESDLLRVAWEGFKRNGPSAESSDEDLGLEGFEDASQVMGANGSQDPSIHSFVADLSKRLSRTAGSDQVALPHPDGEKTVDRESLRTAINEAMRFASEDAKTAAKAGDALQLPSHHVKEAAKSLTKAAQSFRAVSSRNTFDRVAFIEAVAMARRAMDALHVTIEE